MRQQIIPITYNPKKLVACFLGLDKYLYLPKKQMSRKYKFIFASASLPFVLIK